MAKGSRIKIFFDWPDHKEWVGGGGAPLIKNIETKKDNRLINFYFVGVTKAKSVAGYATCNSKLTQNKFRVCQDTDLTAIIQFFPVILFRVKIVQGITVFLEMHVMCGDLL